MSRPELAQIYAAARTSGNDIVLDTLLLRLHVETAARRGGVLGLRVADLDAELCVVLLRERGGTVRWQPISLSLTRALADHAACRGAVLPTDTLFVASASYGRALSGVTSWPCRTHTSLLRSR